MSKTMQLDIQVANEWRQVCGKVGAAGFVVVYQLEAQGWINELRDPENWVIGCVAVNEAGQCWKTAFGSHGGMVWAPVDNAGQAA